jgi:hypothetical protein
MTLPPKACLSASFDWGRIMHPDTITSKSRNLRGDHQWRKNKKSKYSGFV